MRASCVAAGLLACAAATAHAQEFLDQLSDRLTLSAFDGNLRARLSGTVELEYYHFNQPEPGLIDASGHDLFNPRLTLFFDTQAGAHMYFFAQARFDRGFDPSDRGAQIRLDEYALRVTPWDDGRLSVQVGKFAAVFAKWIERHLAWDNPFISAPLVYENTSPLEDFAAPELPFDGHRSDEKYEYIPEIWGPSYASGVSVAGRLQMFEYAAEVKNAALSSRPESWDATRIGFDHPTVNARLSWLPNEAWNVGVSVSDGAYFRPEAEATLPAGRSIGDYHQTVIAEHISFARRRLQIWAEFHQARFDIPRIGDAETFGYFVEAKYKFAPQLFAAIRWNQQFFNEVPNGVGGRVAWAPAISRLETAVTYRFTTHTQLKLQYYVEDEEHRSLAHRVAAQLTVRF